jgi:hypothetical protein
MASLISTALRASDGSRGSKTVEGVGAPGASVGTLVKGAPKSSRVLRPFRPLRCSAESALLVPLVSVATALRGAPKNSSASPNLGDGGIMSAIGSIKPSSGNWGGASLTIAAVGRSVFFFFPRPKKERFCFPGEEGGDRSAILMLI